MKTIAPLLAFMLVALPLTAQVSPTPQPSTVANDDSCDIGNFPAATLLLPYFEVDVSTDNPGLASHTLITIYNVSQVPQIGRATIWTDWGYPVFSFDVFFGGYDVQGYSLFDILRRGEVIVTSNRGPRGVRSLDHVTGNPRFAQEAAASCQAAGGNIDPARLAAIQRALTAGLWPDCPGGERRVGSTSSLAIGYVTIDLVSNCSGRSPLAPGYFEGELLYDNVLTGDAIHIRNSQGFEGRTVAEPLVHIRAVPEGGPAGWFPGTALPFTFYDRLAPPGNRRLDRRQPLPSLFAARYLQQGRGANSELTIWRETPLRREQLLACEVAAAQDGFIEIVRFDESSNPTINFYTCVVTCPPQPDPVLLPAAALTPISHFGIFPPRSWTADLGGWLYLNLSTPARTDRPQQAWVTTEMGTPAMGIKLPALQLGNGCSANPGVTSHGRTGNVIRPAP
jgi:hypothetical protein